MRAEAETPVRHRRGSRSRLHFDDIVIVLQGWHGCRDVLAVVKEIDDAPSSSRSSAGTLNRTAACNAKQATGELDAQWQGRTTGLTCCCTAVVASILGNPPLLLKSL